jgi:hypothetical protein
MRKKSSITKNEQGSVIVLVMMILVILTIIGIAATNTSNIEELIASNEKLYKAVFYAAEGGTEIAAEMLEQNLCCPTGFHGDMPIYIGNASDIDLEVAVRNFWINEVEPEDPYPCYSTPSSPSYQSPFDMHVSFTDNIGSTNLKIFGNTVLSTDSAIQMAAGYEGKGKGTGQGGGHIVYNIYSQHQGIRNSKSRMLLQWKHIIGQEGICIY